jgi:succinate dehydrogenase / fumarate reductase cytochrome b subunit
LGRYPHGRNWAYVWQRVTGILALLFIGYHTYAYRWPLATGQLEAEELFARLCGSLSSTVKFGVPLIAVGYLVGIAAICYHFANGLVNFCFSWGVTVSRRASRRVAGLVGLLAIVLFAMGANLVLYFATGSRLAWTLHDPRSTPAVGCGDLGEPQAEAVSLAEAE